MPLCHRDLQRRRSQQLLLLQRHLLDHLRLIPQALHDHPHQHPLLLLLRLLLLQQHTKPPRTFLLEPNLKYH